MGRNIGLCVGGCWVNSEAAERGNEFCRRFGVQTPPAAIGDRDCVSMNSKHPDVEPSVDQFSLVVRTVTHHMKSDICKPD